MSHHRLGVALNIINAEVLPRARELKAFMLVGERGGSPLQEQDIGCFSRICFERIFIDEFGWYRGSYKPSSLCWDEGFFDFPVHALHGGGDK